MNFSSKKRRFFILIFIILNSNLVFSQLDSLSGRFYLFNGYDDEWITKLPVVRTDGLYELNPSMVGLFRPLSFYSDGFGITNDYAWMNGVPVRYVEEMPLRMVGRVVYDAAGKDLMRSNSMVGYACLEKSASPDSVISLVEGNFSVVRKKTDDFDLQWLLAGPLRFGKGRANSSVSASGTVAARAFSSYDPNPSYIERKTVSDGYREYLANEPLRPTGLGSGTYANALFTHPQDSKGSYFDSNAGKKGYYLLGNIALKSGNGMELEAGSHFLSKNEFISVYENYFFNQEANPERKTRYTNSYLRFGQQVQRSETSSFYYQLTGQYSFQRMTLQHPDHQDDLFRYGYSGKFDSYKKPSFELGSAEIDGVYYPEIWLLNSWDYGYLVEYEPGGLNPGLAGYTSSYFNIYEGDPEGHYQNMDQVLLGGGLPNGRQPGAVYYRNNIQSLWKNTGTVYDKYTMEDEGQWRIGAEGGLSFGKHQVNMGGYFVRTTYSGYSSSPVELWRAMNGLSNFHIYSLDTDHPEIHPGDPLDTVFFYRSSNEMAQRYFDKMLRQRLGLDVDGVEYIDIDSYDYRFNTIGYYDDKGVRRTLSLDGSLFSMDLFKPDELINLGLAEGYGYDYYGNKVRGKVSFDDYYHSRNEDGEYLRPVQPYTPLNWAAFAEYSFRQENWSLRAGLKLDVFDANQMVLEDLTLVYPFTNLIQPSDFTGYKARWNLLPQLSFTIRPFNRTQLQVGYNSSVQYPDHNIIFSHPAVYNNFIHGHGYDYLDDPSEWYIPNGNLVPERSDRANIDLSYLLGKKMLASASFFANMYSHAIWLVAWENPRYPFTNWVYENSEDQVLHYGLDLGLARRSFRASGIDFGVTYHLLLNHDEEFISQFALRVPKHLLKGHFIFNTGHGMDYTGPAGKTAQTLFERVGASLMAQYRSGIFYAMEDGSSAKLPSSFIVDLKLEKGISFRNPDYSLNFYIVIQNLFDTRVLFEVYPATGQPDDDGFLSDPLNQKYIADQLDPQAFRFLYSSYVNNPDHYGLPRRVYFGVKFSFQ